MIKINWLKIVPFFAVVFTLFFNPISANGLEEIKSKTVSGGYFIGRMHESAIIRFKNETVPVDDFGYFQIGFSRDTSGEHAIEIIKPDGTQTTYPLSIESREFNIQRVTGVKQETVTPPKSVLARIEAEYIQVKESRAGVSDLTAWRDETFIWPVFGRISGVYGSQRYYNGTAGSPHWGIDMAAKQGTPVYAPASGKIVLAEADLFYSGGTIILDHGNGLTSSFLHLSKLNVEAGEYLLQGQVLGFVGSTGRSTGPHLDWRMNLHDQRIDAELWVPSMSSLCIFDTKSCPVPDGLSHENRLAWLINREAVLTRSASEN